MKVYTLKKKKDTNEYHLFEATPNHDKTECTPKKYSICEKMIKEESESNKFACLEEDDARLKIAKTGRSVCGVCASHLYETY